MIYYYIMTNIRIITWNVGESHKVPYSDNLYYPMFRNIIMKKINNKYPDIIVFCTQEDTKKCMLDELFTNITNCKDLSKYTGIEYQYFSEYNNDVTDVFVNNFKIKIHMLLNNKLSDDISVKFVKNCIRKGMLCTKGGIAVNIKWGDKQIKVYNNHLPVDSKKDDMGYDKRLSGFKNNIKKFDDKFKNIKDGKSVTFIAGDLNFRMYKKDSKYQDQLINNVDLYNNFKEADIKFPPTCKAKINREGKKFNLDRYQINVGDGNDRIPSYCDRILYSTNNNDINIVNYDSYVDGIIKFSDHDLVYLDAIF